MTLSRVKEEHYTGWFGFEGGPADCVHRADRRMEAEVSEEVTAVTLTGLEVAPIGTPTGQAQW